MTEIIRVVQRHSRHPGRVPGATGRQTIRSMMEAVIAREMKPKRWPRGWKRNLIERENPLWNDLAGGFGVSRWRHSLSRGGPRHEAGVTKGR